MYKSNDLKWVKNVKSQGGAAWAYAEFGVEDFFKLHWSIKMRANVSKAAINDLILIFQTLNSPKGTFLTHIVTPITDEVGEDRKIQNHPFTRTVLVIGKADPIDSIPKPTNLDFFRPNRGAVCKIETIKDFRTKSDIPINKLQSQIFSLFKTIDLELDEMVVSQNDDHSIEEEFEEGKRNEALRRHRYYERNPKVIQKAKEEAIKNGRLFCEVCKFNFESTYDSLGKGFIECHHKKPIAQSGVRKTRVDDLGIVCANCHRMLHRKRKIDNRYLTIEELRDNYFTTDE